MQSLAPTLSACTGSSSFLLYHSSCIWPSQRRCLGQVWTVGSACCAVAAEQQRSINASVSSFRQCRTAVAATARPPRPTDDSTNDPQQGQDADANTGPRLQPPQRGEDRSSNGSRVNVGSPFSIDDPQLLVGDCVALVAAALYRQIAAIVLSPTFPGWFAPLTFNPLRFAEFANFAGMLVASWVVAATLTGGYSGAAVGAGVPGALRASCRAWLVAMPICAAHLVLVTASESQALVTDEGFAGVLPLAATGPGEPLGTAAALLGLMAMWRCFYAVYLDSWVWASPRNVAEDAARFREALASVALVAAGCSVLLQVLQLTASLSDAGPDGGTLGQLLLL